MCRRGFSIFSSSGRAGVLVRAVVGSAGLRVLGMGLGFLVGVQLARSLGPTGYGIYGIAMSWISIAMIPTELGLSQLVTRESAIAAAAGDHSRIWSLTSWAFRLIVVNAVGVIILMLIILWVLSPALDENLRTVIICGFALLPLAAIGSVSSAALRGMHHLVAGQLIELVIRPGLLSLGLFLVWVMGDNNLLAPELAMLFNVLAAGVGAIAILRWLRHLLPSVESIAQTAYTRQRWIRSAIPLALSEGMRVVSGNLPILVLGLLAPAHEVGWYRVAAGIYTAAILPSALLNVACSPMLATLYSEKRNDAIQRVNAWMALLLVFASIICLIPFLVAGEPILSIVFGQEYAAANTILLVLLTGELASAMLGHPAVVLNMIHREKAVTKFSFISLLMNCLFSILLIPILGGVGAAIGVAVSQFIWRLLCWHFSKQELGLETSILAWGKK